MSPESTNERLVRAETRLEEQGKIIAAVAPLVTQYAVLEERLEGFGGDLNNGLDAIRKEVAAVRETAAKEAEATRNAAVTVATAAREAADKQFKAIETRDAENRKSRRAIYAALGLSLFGLVSNVVLQLAGLGGGHP